MSLTRESSHHLWLPSFGHDPTITKLSYKLINYTYPLSISHFCLFLSLAGPTKFFFSYYWNQSPLVSCKHKNLLIVSFFWALEHLAAPLAFLSVSWYRLYSFNKDCPGGHGSHIILNNLLSKCKSLSTYP